MPSTAEMESYIREAAVKRGIDPDVAVRVARSEGLARGVWQSKVVGGKYNRREPSYGPFQLLVGGGDTGYPAGLGNRFKSSTGLDPADPKNWRATVDYGLDVATKEGWGHWYGARDQGIKGKMGMSPKAGPAGVTGEADETAVADAGGAPDSDAYPTVEPIGDVDAPDIPDEPESKYGKLAGALGDIGESMMEPEKPIDYTPAGENMLDESIPQYDASGIPIDAYRQYTMSAQEGGPVEGLDENEFLDDAGAAQYFAAFIDEFTGDDGSVEEVQQGIPVGESPFARRLREREAPSQNIEDRRSDEGLTEEELDQMYPEVGGPMNEEQLRDLTRGIEIGR